MTHKVQLPKSRITLDLDYELLLWVQDHAQANKISRNEAIGNAVEKYRALEFYRQSREKEA